MRCFIGAFKQVREELGVAQHHSRILRLLLARGHISANGIDKSHSDPSEFIFLIIPANAVKSKRMRKKKAGAFAPTCKAFARFVSSRLPLPFRVESE